MTIGGDTRTSIRQKMALPLIFLLVVVAIFLVGLLPATRELGRTNSNIEKLREDLERQEILLPIHFQLQNQTNQPLPEGISAHRLEAFKVDDLDGLPVVFQELAGSSNLKLISVTPQARSLEGDRELLRVDALLRGEFENFQLFLNRLNKMPTLETVESLAINVDELGPEMRLSIWLAIK
ncbi:MAG: hypothetical protein ABF379_16375 [Akkermansiaceae bacterium]